MPALNAIAHDPPQAPICCDTLTRLGNTIEREEFLERVPWLQLPWGSVRDPILTAYMRAKLADVCSRQDDQISLADAKAAARGAWQEFSLRIAHREQGGLRRCADSWARHLAAEQLASKVEQQKNGSARIKRDRRNAAFDTARPHVFIAESDTTVRPLVIRKPRHD
jgi:hypothetical protein